MTGAKFQASEVDEWVRTGGTAVSEEPAHLIDVVRARQQRASEGGDIPIRFVPGQKEVHMMSEVPARYALSFTSGALLMREALVAAPIYLRQHDWSHVRGVIEEENLLQSRTRSSGLRLAREVAERLSVLTDDEIELLVDATTSERGHLMWAAACRRYNLIGEFAEEVLRERFLLLVSTLGHGDFDGFIRGKALWHEEVAELKDSTLRKLRSNVFRMLVEAGLLSDDGRILQAVLSTRIAEALSRRIPSDLRFFPTGGAA